MPSSGGTNRQSRRTSRSNVTPANPSSGRFVDSLSKHWISPRELELEEYWHSEFCEQQLFMNVAKRNNYWTHVLVVVTCVLSREKVAFIELVVTLGACLVFIDWSVQDYTKGC